jgi:small subunit ribosomal protein S16
MAVKIRLARGGSKKRPYYRVVVADVRAPRDGRYIEKIGTHNPLLPKDHDDRIKIDLERAKYWLGQGAQPTDRVARFLAAEGLVKWEHGNNPNKGKPHAKANERAEEKAEKAAALKEAAEAPKEEAPAEEAPAEEAKAEEAPKEDASKS